MRIQTEQELGTKADGPVQTAQNICPILSHDGKSDKRVSDR